MDPQPNPYAPPTADIRPSGDYESDAYWRQGNVLFLRVGRALPPRCVKCNAPAKLPMKPLKLYWHSPFTRVLQFACLVAFIFVFRSGAGGNWLIPILLVSLFSMAATKRTAVIPGLCAAHKLRGLLFSFLDTVVIFAFAVALISGFQRLSSFALVAICIAFIVLNFLLRTYARTLEIKRITPDVLHFKGAGQPFLDSLPTQ